MPVPQATARTSSEGVEGVRDVGAAIAIALAANGDDFLPRLPAEENFRSGGDTRGEGLARIGGISVEVMIGGEHFHVVRPRGLPEEVSVALKKACVVLHCSGVAGVAPAETESGHDTRHFGYVALVISRNRKPGLGIELETAIEVTLHQTDREELHDLARIILVGGDGAASFLVLKMAEVDAHERAVGHLFQHGPVGSEGVRREHVPVGCGAVVIVVYGCVVLRDDDDLGKGESHALAQLVAAIENEGEPLTATVLVKGMVVLVDRAGIPVPCHGIELGGIAAELGVVVKSDRFVPAQDKLFEVRRFDERFERGRGSVARGGAHLLVNPGGVAGEGVVAVRGDEIAHFLNRFGSGSEARLHQESHDVTIEFRIVRGAFEREVGKLDAPVDSRCLGGRRVDNGARGGLETPANFSARKIAAGDADVQRTGLQRVEGRLIGLQDLRGTDRPGVIRDLPVGDAGNLEVATHADVGRILCRGEIAERKTDDGGVVVSLNKSGHDPRGRGNDIRFGG